MSDYIKNLFKEKPTNQEREFFEKEYKLSNWTWADTFIVLIKEIERLNKKIK